GSMPASASTSSSGASTPSPAALPRTSSARFAIREPRDRGSGSISATTSSNLRRVKWDRPRGRKSITGTGTNVSPLPDKHKILGTQIVGHARYVNADRKIFARQPQSRGKNRLKAIAFARDCQTDYPHVHVKLLN